MRLRPGLWAVLGVASAAAVALAVLTSGMEPAGRVVYSGDDGPLGGATARTTDTVAVDVGQPRTWGGVIVVNRKGPAAVIDGFRVSPPIAGGLRLLGTAVANDPDRKFVGTGPMEGRASPESLGRLVPLVGAQVPRHDRGAAVVLDLEATRPGIFWVDRVDVDFHVGTRRYTVRNDTRLVLCAPRPLLEDCRHFREHPSEACAPLGYVRDGDNGCVPPPPGSH